MFKDNKSEYWPFQVMAKSQGEAKQMLKEYLKCPKQTGIKYISCVGIRELPSDSILVTEEIRTSE